MKYAVEHDITVDSEKPILHNLDLVNKWLEGKNVELIECHTFNGAWNLFADVSRSINGGFDPNQDLTQKIYNKLFWGCNVPSVKPEGKQYHPAWTRRELKIMAEVLGSGMQMFREYVKS